MSRLVLLVTSPRVPAGLLSAESWQALHAGPVYAAELDSPNAAALTAAGVTVIAAGADQPTDVIAQVLLDAARRSGNATWLVGPAGHEGIASAVNRLSAPSDASGGAVEVSLINGSWDLPGARLLDVVATVDRLRSPGGCPWDAQQGHDSLAPYLLEEAYEACQAIEDADSPGLCEELGDVLFQVAFHARLGEELPGAERWSIDDVAAGLDDKLRRRHPHVFGGVEVDGADEVNANWEAIKAAERGDASVVANVALAAPALTLAATLQRKAERAGLAPTPTPTGPALRLSAAAQRFERSPSGQTAGALLWAAVATMRAAGIDAEAALRAHARGFRDGVAAADEASRRPQA